MYTMKQNKHGSKTKEQSYHKLPHKLEVRSSAPEHSCVNKPNLIAFYRIKHNKQLKISKTNYTEAFIFD